MAAGAGEWGGLQPQPQGLSLIDLPEGLPEPAGHPRLVFIEDLTVTQDSVTITIRAASDIQAFARSTTGDPSDEITMLPLVQVPTNQTIEFVLPLGGPAPDLSISWYDSTGRWGGIALKGPELPYPLPSVHSHFCTFSLTSLKLTPASLQGEVERSCVNEGTAELEIPTETGHLGERFMQGTRPAIKTGDSATLEMVLNGIDTSGIVTMSTGPSTTFSTPSTNESGLQDIMIDIEVSTTMNVSMPPLIETEHHPPETVTFRRRIVNDVYRTWNFTIPSYVSSKPIPGTPVTHTTQERVTLRTTILKDPGFVMPAVVIPTPVVPLPPGDLDEFLLFLPW